MISVPLPLLVLPWLLALGVWIAFPWLARRTGHPERLRWLPPGLVVIGGALLWLSAGPSDGHAAPVTVPGAHAGLCDARAALPDDRELAVRAFQDRAHDALHTLAADPDLDRALGADLLRAKEEVESLIAATAPGPTLVEPMDRLISRTEAALRDVGTEVSSCDA